MKIVILGAMLVGLFSFPLLSQQTVVLTLENNQAPRTCGRALLSTTKLRSSPPENEFFGFCGAFIFEGNIILQLPESRFFSAYHEHREEIFDMLQVGCTYEMVVRGAGELEPNERMRVGAVPYKDIVKVVRELGCDQVDSD